MARKPQAVRQVADELVGDLGAPFDVLWRQLVDERGPKLEAIASKRVVAITASAASSGLKRLNFGRVRKPVIAPSAIEIQRFSTIVYTHAGLTRRAR